VLVCLVPSWSRLVWCAWSRLGVEPPELSEIAVNRGVFLVLLGLQIPRSSPEKKGVTEWMNEILQGYMGPAVYRQRSLPHKKVKTCEFLTEPFHSTRACKFSSPRSRTAQNQGWDHSTVWDAISGVSSNPAFCQLEDGCCSDGCAIVKHWFSHFWDTFFCHRVKLRAKHVSITPFTSVQIRQLQNDQREKDILIHQKMDESARLAKELSQKSNEASILRKSVENLREQVRPQQL